MTNSRPWQKVSARRTVGMEACKVNNEAGRSSEQQSTAAPHTDFAASMSYGVYLQLDKLLNAQHPRSDCHDEMLIIIIHQATELWMKLTLHEREAARRLIIADDLSPAFKHSA